MDPFSNDMVVLTWTDLEHPGRCRWLVVLPDGKVATRDFEQLTDPTRNSQLLTPGLVPEQSFFGHDARPDSDGSALFSDTRSSDSDGQRPPLVLVVDDQSINRLVAKRILQKMDCQVLLAADGDEVVHALDAASLRRRPIDFVLTDVRGCCWSIAWRHWLVSHSYTNTPCVPLLVARRLTWKRSAARKR